VRFRSRPLAAVLLLATIHALGGCQSLGNWATGRLSPMEWNGQTRIELPLTSSSWQSPTVLVRVAGRDASALIDSGSSGPGMNRALAIATGLRIHSSGPKVNGKRRESVEDVPIQLGSVSSEILISGVDDHNDSPPIILGSNLFLQAVVEMDFDAGRLTLINPKEFSRPEQEPVRVKLLNALPTIQLKLKGSEKEVCAVVDTGFFSGLAVTPEIVSEHSLPRDLAGRKLVMRGTFGARHEQEALAPLDQLQIGDRLYRQVPTAYSPSLFENCPNLLGMAVLSQSRLIFDLKNRHIWLLPRSGTPSRADTTVRGR
jgi:hypothetical protein